MFKLKHRCLSLLAVLFLAACANVVAPTGGPKDVTPPKVVASQPENHSTGFSGRKVEITFDEYVTLNNASQQVLVSPPLFNKPDIKLNNRTLVIKFKEDLKANTTYVLDFGQAVKDLHEGNTFKDYLFTFATGDVIDTLTLSGAVLDADTKKPVESFMVGLYAASPHDEFGEGALSDSIFTRPLFRAPDYLTRTDKEGHFHFIGLPDVPFLVFGIEDMNSNLYYDLPNERVAFLDSLVCPSDSVHLALSAFTATDTTQMLLENKVVEEGLLRLAFRHPADSVDIRLSWPETDTFQLVQVWNHHHDTLNCWFTPNVLDTLHAEIHYDTLINISALVNLQFRDTKPQRGKASKTLKVGTNLRNKMLMPGDDFLLRFAEPIVSCTDTCFEHGLTEVDKMTAVYFAGILNKTIDNVKSTAKWFEQCDDYAMMIPITEMCESPAQMDFINYYYERDYENRNADRALKEKAPCGWPSRGCFPTNTSSRPSSMSTATAG